MQKEDDDQQSETRAPKRPQEETDGRAKKKQRINMADASVTTVSTDEEAVAASAENETPTRIISRHAPVYVAFIATSVAREKNNVISRLFTDEHLDGYIQNSCASDFLQNIIATISAANKDNFVARQMCARIVDLSMSLNFTHLLRSKELYQTATSPDMHDDVWFEANDENHGDCFVWSVLEPRDRCHKSAAECLQYRTLELMFALFLKQADRCPILPGEIRSNERMQQDGLIYILVTFLMQQRPGKFRTDMNTVDYHVQFMQLMETIINIGGRELGSAHDEVVEFAMDSVNAEYNWQARYLWRLVRTFSSFGSMSVILRTLVHAYKVQVCPIVCHPGFQNVRSLCAATNMYYPTAKLMTLTVENMAGVITTTTVHSELRNFFLDTHLLLNPHHTLARYHEHTLLHCETWKRMILLMHERCISNSVFKLSEKIDDIMQAGVAECRNLNRHRNRYHH